ncbi:alpha/beta fold hydrolase [Pantoea alhagi]|uniref:alpha/beta fold hydrolase n=1 Tax=Pantoea alhagi TaxID=1891675 RepID=UPI003B849E35
MLPYSSQGQGETTLVLMHYLGGSHRTWFPTLPYLDRHYRCVALNTPGFGDAAEVKGYDVDSMVRQVDETLRGLGLNKVILAGHSMTGKVALALAAQRPAYLQKLVLVAPSPPGPQPMSNEDREAQASYQGTRQEAEKFVDGSCSARLPDPLREVAIADAQSASLAAWHAWRPGTPGRYPAAGKSGVNALVVSIFRRCWCWEARTETYLALMRSGK